MNIFKKINPNKLPIIFQDEVSECGIACVAMVGCYLGHSINLSSIREMTGVSVRGTTMMDIITLCEKLKILTRVIRIEIDQLKFVKTPAILHWNMNHFVVLKKTQNDKIVIHDPSIGLRKYSLAEASKYFTGIALEAEREINFSPIVSNNKLTLYQLVKQVRGVISGFFTLGILSIITEVLGLTSPLFVQFVMDKVVTPKDMNLLYVLSIIFLILIITQSFTEYIRSHAIVFLTNNLNEQLTSNVVKHLLKLPLAYFERRHKVDILSRFQSIQQIQSKFSVDAVNLLLDGTMVVICLCIMCIYSLTLVVIVSIALFIFILIRYITFKTLNALNEASLRDQAKASAIFLENLHAILVIKSFAREKTRFNLWFNNYMNGGCYE